MAATGRRWPAQPGDADPSPALSLYTLSTFPAATGVLWAYYLPGNWIPHCALAEGLDRSEAGRAFELLADYRPITAQVTSAGIKDTATGAITLLTG